MHNLQVAQTSLTPNYLSNYLLIHTHLYSILL